MTLFLRPLNNGGYLISYKKKNISSSDSLNKLENIVFDYFYAWEESVQPNCLKIKIKKVSFIKLLIHWTSLNFADTCHW